ncbi:MAG: transcription elongation factor GreA [Ruminococcaceae bacterium]|nr:transcription elongation factor GreA [Oscillospiraceae bacterium]
MSDKQRNYTAAGFKALQDELDHIRHVDMERNKKDIAQARSFGDLSENSEYDEAKNEQAKLAARAFELEELIKNAHVVDDSEIDSSVVSVGSIVEVHNQERDKDITYHIVGSYETDPVHGKISDQSPIGQALIGARTGDQIPVELPNGNTVHLHILSVSRA